MIGSGGMAAALSGHVCLCRCFWDYRHELRLEELLVGMDHPDAH